MTSLDLIHIEKPYPIKSELLKTADELTISSVLGIPKITISEEESTAASHVKNSILHSINISVSAGETLSIIGPSGCGKSSLLRIIAGIDSDYTGSVHYDGNPVDNIPVKDRGIGMVFQNYALYPHFKGEGNLSFFFKNNNVIDTETKERIRITSEIMGIGFEELLKRKPGKLSGGQQQRLAIGRAIVRTPRIFIFDEPLSNLDAKMRQTSRIELKKLLRRFSITTVYVTHDQSEASLIGDKIAVMRSGSFEQIGTYQEILQKPATSFVAGFTGNPPMNLFYNCEIVDRIIHSCGSKIPIRSIQSEHVLCSNSLTWGFRPESAIIDNNLFIATDCIKLKGIIEGIEPDISTDRTQLFLRNGKDTFSVIIPFETRTSLGSTFEFRIPNNKIFYFDPISEKIL